MNGLADLVERVRTQVVAIENGHRGAGAGTLVAPDRVLTNNLVAVRDRLTIVFRSGKQVSGVVRARDPEIDLALIEAPSNGQPGLAIATADSIRTGHLVMAVGHPLGHRDVVTVGIISSLETARTDGPRSKIPVIRSDVVLLPGNSGGPLVNAHGALVGINTLVIGGDQGYAIPADLVRTFLADHL